MIKRRHLSSIQKDKNVCRNRRYARAITLAEKFERNTRMTEKTVWQDEKDFTLDVPVNLQNDRVYGKNLMFQMRTCLRPRIRFQENLWFPLQSLGTAPRNRFL